MTISTKTCFLILLSLFLAASVFAQIPTLTWEQLSHQPKVDFKEVQKAFERDYPAFKANWEKQKTLRQTAQSQQTELQKIENQGNGLDPMMEQFKRWEADIVHRLDENGIYDREKENKSISAFLSKNKSQLRNSSSSSANWQPLGLFKNDRFENANAFEATIGKVHSILAHPTDSLTFYIGGASSGVWKTTDGGKTWQFLSQTWEKLNYYNIQLVMSPSNPDIIYAILEESYYYKTTDGGATWAKLSINVANNGNATILKLYIDPANANNMIANSFYPYYMMKSSDGGQTWSINRNGSLICSLVFQPNNTSIVYFSDYFGGIFKSTDGGDSYFKIFQNPDGNTSSSRLAVTPAAPNNVYYSSVNQSGGTPVFMSHNNGNSFNRITPINNYWSNSGNVSHALAVSPTDPNDIWSGMGDLQRTTNGGVSWNNVISNDEVNNTMYIHSDLHALVFQPNTNKLFIGTDGGLYRFNGIINAKKNFDLFGGYNNSEVNFLGTLENAGTQILFGTQSNGTHLLKGGKFTKLLAGSGGECLINLENTSENFCSTSYGFLTKNGASITPNPFPVYPNYLAPWEMHPTNPQIMYACYSHIYKTIDGGNNWTALYNSPNTWSLKISRSNPNILYAAGGNVIYRSTDAGENWFSITVPIYTYRIAIDPNDAYTVYVISYGSKVYKTSDGGFSWNDISGTLPQYFLVSSIAIDKNNASDVYIGTELGVYVFDTSLNDWVYFNDGLPKISVTELEINYMNGGKIRAATYGRGVWESPLKTPCTPPTATFIVTTQTSDYAMTLQANTGAGLTYQWLKDGYTIAGATSANYTTNSAGEYSVIVTSGNCSQISNVKTICPNYKNITQAIYGPTGNTEEYKAAQIDATNIIQNNNVEYKATKSITLYPGFVINNNDQASFFKAEINGCY